MLSDPEAIPFEARTVAQCAFYNSSLFRHQIEGLRVAASKAAPLPVNPSNRHENPFVGFFTMSGCGKSRMLHHLGYRDEHVRGLVQKAGGRLVPLALTLNNKTQADWNMRPVVLFQARILRNFFPEAGIQELESFAASFLRDVPMTELLGYCLEKSLPPQPESEAAIPFVLLLVDEVTKWHVRVARFARSDCSQISFRRQRN